MTDFLVNVSDTLKKRIQGGVVRTDAPLSVPMVAALVTTRFERALMEMYWRSFSRKKSSRLD